MSSSSAKPYRVLSCLKVLLILFTVFLLFTGVLFLATGIYSLIALYHYIELSTEVNITVMPVALCGIGGFIIISGLFGFLSAVKNNKCMVNCYCSLIGVVFLTEIAGAITAVIFMNQIEDSFKTGINKALRDYNPSVPNAIDKAQSELQCCGADSFEDWFSTMWVNETSQCGSNYSNSTTVPLSCCKVTSSDEKTLSEACYCGSELDKMNVNQQGCLSVLFGSSGQTLGYLLATSFAMAAAQLLGILLSLCIYRKLREISAVKRHY